MSMGGNMSRVKIVTDSTAYIAPELVLKYDLRVVPLSVIFGEKVYAEGVDITNEEFYKRLQSKPLPKTSHPSVADFAKAYTELTKGGNPVLSIHVSGKLSSTVDAARAAAKELSGAQIEVVDSQLTAMALGMVVLAAAKAAD